MKTNKPTLEVAYVSNVSCLFGDSFPLRSHPECDLRAKWLLCEYGQLNVILYNKVF